MGCEITTAIANDNVVNYLLAEKNDIVTAVSILITYCLITIFLIASFLRLTYTTYCDPPYVPLGKFQTQEQGNNGIEENYSDKEKFMASGLESFHEKNVFISDYTGRPFWCSHCANWKPDRAHHCSQTGRCIRKMDHFCPWVGGPVGENNFKASTFLLFSGGMSFHGIRLATSNMTQVERIGAKRRVYNFVAIVPPKENLTSKNNILQSLENRSFITYPIIHNLEQLMWPKPTLNSSISQKALNLDISHAKNIRTSESDHVSQPRMLNNNALEESQTHREVLSSSLQKSSIATIENENSELNNIYERNPDFLEMPLKDNTSQSGPPNSDSEETLPKNVPHQRLYRTFVILKTNEGENPWDLGSRLLNWKTVMGNNILDWFLPIHRSPCCNHDNPESQFDFGFAIDNHLSRLGLTKSGGIQDFSSDS
ncbi:hypothetical protein EPUL_002462 [Erysiphe pulchra]|uniref:Palmitoyltransferase n=1 Tax=Erysiphe pulchra TaxID=225359 RepID=A0A2S4PXC9_9PEZI|nr:hypothetical protein EPUL_002462 [Erysiphe pulchra]